MAKKAKRKKLVPQSAVRNARRKMKPAAWLFSSCALILAIFMLPTSFMLVVGLLPTFVAFFVAKRKERAQVASVAAMNAAGCSPFLFQLWGDGNTLEIAMHIVMDPLVVSVMYFSAALGYLIDWGLGGVMAVLLRQRASSRLQAVEKQQSGLIARWGEKVSGDLELDEEGFPIEGLMPNLSRDKEAVKKK